MEADPATRGRPIVERMLSGHQRFMAGYFEREKALFRGLAEASDQPCLALVVACSDSRVVPELIVDARPGDIFMVRNVANIVPPMGSADSSAGAAIEYALGHLPDLKHVIVWGHYGCGGVKALLEGTDTIEAEPKLRQWVSLAQEARRRLDEEGGLETVDERWRRLVELNVVLQQEHLLSYPVVAEALEARRAELHAWLYDINTSRLKSYHPELGFQWVE